jgi:excisionase family DNA binding protein
MAKEIEPNQVYTTKESQDFLRVSNSTIKRFLKKGILKANKVGGRYRVLGRELLRLVSPEAEQKAVRVYQNLKKKTKKTIEKW